MNHAFFFRSFSLSLSPPLSPHLYLSTVSFLSIVSLSLSLSLSLSPFYLLLNIPLFSIKVLDYLQGGELLDVICTFESYSEDAVKDIILQLTEYVLRTNFVSKTYHFYFLFYIFFISSDFLCLFYIVVFFIYFPQFSLPDKSFFSLSLNLPYAYFFVILFSIIYLLAENCLKLFFI